MNTRASYEEHQKCAQIASKLRGGPSKLSSFKYVIHGNKLFGKNTCKKNYYEWPMVVQANSQAS